MTGTQQLELQTRPFASAFNWKCATALQLELQCHQCRHGRVSTACDCSGASQWRIYLTGHGVVVVVFVVAADRTRGGAGDDRRAAERRLRRSPACVRADDGCRVRCFLITARLERESRVAIDAHYMLGLVRQGDVDSLITADHYFTSIVSMRSVNALLLSFHLRLAIFLQYLNRQVGGRTSCPSVWFHVRTVAIDSMRNCSSSKYC